MANTSVPGVDLTNKKVILDPRYYKGTDEERTFMCTGGFGCVPSCIGRACLGYFVSDGEKARVNREEILCLAPGETR